MFAGAMGAAPCWYIAILFIVVWQAPMVVDEGRWVKLAVGIMVLEFILVHSGVFFEAFSGELSKTGKPLTQARRVLMMASLVSFHLIFAVVISFVFKSWMLLSMFCWVTGSRLLSGFVFMKDHANAAMIRSCVSVLLYLSAVFLSVFVSIPPGGISADVLDKVYPGRGSGIWEQNPQQALLAGVYYFGLLGAWELVAPFKMGKLNS